MRHSQLLMHRWQPITKCCGQKPSEAAPLGAVRRCQWRSDATSVNTDGAVAWLSVEIRSETAVGRRLLAVTPLDADGGRSSDAMSMVTEQPFETPPRVVVGALVAAADASVTADHKVPWAEAVGGGATRSSAEVSVEVGCDIRQQRWSSSVAVGGDQE